VSAQEASLNMKMMVVALIGGVVLGFVDAQFLVQKLQGLATNPTTQNMLTTGAAAFLGVIWGWMAKGLIGGKPKD
jgi:hypothetical protein